MATKYRAKLRKKGPTSIPADQKWFWTPEWQAGEREASAQIAAGEGKSFDSTEEFLAHLETLDAEAEQVSDGGGAVRS